MSEKSLPVDNSVAPMDLAVAVIIVNWRTAALVANCLQSLVGEVRRFREFRVVVVDNDSGDGSVQILEELINRNGWDAWARVLHSPRNGGFAAGNNAGLRELKAEGFTADFVLLLNPDTYIRAGAVAELAAFLQANLSAGIVGAQNEDPDGTPQFGCFRFHNVISELSAQLGVGIFDRMAANWITRIELPTEPTEVDWVAGSAMMVRHQVFEQMGLMDESYFLYYEETDFMLRARRAGWQCWYLPSARVVHLVGQSTGVTRREGPRTRLPAYWFESRRRYFLLNHGMAYTIAADLAVIAGAACASLRALVQPRSTRLAPRFLRDFILTSVLLKGRRGITPRQTEW